MKGAERGGLTGFAKGVGTGVLGLVVKPVVGVTDAATDVLQGICRILEDGWLGRELFSPICRSDLQRYTLFKDSLFDWLDGLQNTFRCF